MNASVNKYSEKNNTSYLVKQNNIDYALSENGNWIIIEANSKDIYKIFPCEILYIATEGRKSVLYLTDKEIETNRHLDYWKNILDPKIFVQPHGSYIVNLNYVVEITKEWAMVKSDGKKYLVYTSTRKIKEFRKAFLEYYQR